ncbi:hypothetical protein N9L47_02110 [Rhodobacteraceae bacterium]|nr:hypothetical protein [Paracoccaceae bacterium]
MSTDIFLPILTFATLFAVIFFAMKSRKDTIARMNDDSVNRSHLATDGKGPDPVPTLNSQLAKDGVNT